MLVHVHNMSSSTCSLRSVFVTTQEIGDASVRLRELERTNKKATKADEELSSARESLRELRAKVAQLESANTKLMADFKARESELKLMENNLSGVYSFFGWNVGCRWAM